MLTVCAAGALVLDRLWIDAAELQLQAAAEAAALAAATRIVGDHQLRDSDAAVESLDAARAAAERIARANTVSGRPVELDVRPGEDVLFGSSVESVETGDKLFLETDVDPTTALVTARRSRRRDSGLLVFFRAVTGRPLADAFATAAATVDNRVSGIRPLPGSTVACLPLGILGSDPTGRRQDTWEHQIDRGNGQDRYRYDAVTGQVLSGQDGIREMILTVESAEKGVRPPNVRMLDLGTRFVEPAVREQISGGVSRNDLELWGGELSPTDAPLRIDSSAPLVAAFLNDLVDQVGAPRLCLLYATSSTTEPTSTEKADVTRLVAVRLLTLEHSDPGPVRIVVQPTVIATRTAVLSRRDDAGRNPYIYNLSLTD